MVTEGSKRLNLGDFERKLRQNRQIMTVCQSRFGPSNSIVVYLTSLRFSHVPNSPFHLHPLAPNININTSIKSKTCKSSGSVHPTGPGIWCVPPQEHLMRLIEHGVYLRWNTSKIWTGWILEERIRNHWFKGIRYGAACSVVVKLLNLVRSLVWPR